MLFTEKPIDPRNILAQAISNVICSVVFGNRFEYEDLKFLKLISLFNETFLILSSTCGQVPAFTTDTLIYVYFNSRQFSKTVLLCIIRAAQWLALLPWFKSWSGNS